MTDRKIRLITIILDNTVTLLTALLPTSAKRKPEFLAILERMEELKNMSLY